MIIRRTTALILLPHVVLLVLNQDSILWFDLVSGLLLLLARQVVVGAIGVLALVVITWLTALVDNLLLLEIVKGVLL